MKKALQLASVASMIDQFSMSNIELLQSLGYHVDVVADYTNPGNISNERSEELQSRLKEMGAEPIDIPIPRTMDPFAIRRAYKLVKILVTTEHYDLIHCHSPIGGAITRMAAKSERKIGTRVIYTAHGFHFYDGAPVKNWLIYYPVEKWLSKYTDVLITINQEDYKRAEKFFHSTKTVYIPGVGVDTEKFKPRESGRDKIRKELGIPEERVLLLSVGELNENKNHNAVIRAIQGISNLTYVIVGKGELKDKLETSAKECNVDLRVMGYRADVVDFYNAADVYILPSIREGLNVSLMEAMASGLASCASRIRGNVDLVDDCLFSPTNIGEIREVIKKVIEKKEVLGQRNQIAIKRFGLQNVIAQTIYIYNDMLTTT